MTMQVHILLVHGVRCSVTLEVDWQHFYLAAWEIHPLFSHPLLSFHLGPSICSRDCKEEEIAN